MTTNDPVAFFWSLGEELLREEEVSIGKILGFPCRRCHGEFFATAEHRTGDLIVTLPAERVAELIALGQGDDLPPRVASSRNGCDLPNGFTVLERLA